MIVELRVVLGSDDAFQRAKEALVKLWEHRSSDELHEIFIHAWKRKRTVSQNSRYWALLTEISDQVKPEGNQYSPETWHEYFKSRFIGKDTMLVDGESEVVAKSSTSLGVKEFGDYMTQIEAWGAEHNVRFSL